jgi:hypothetical protein
MFYHKCHWLHYDYFCYQDHRCFTTSVTNCTVTISVIRITDVLSHFVTNCTVTISAIRITKMCYQKCHWLYCDYFCYQGFRMFLLPFFTLPYSCYNYFHSKIYFVASPVYQCRKTFWVHMLKLKCLDYMI